MRTLFEIIEQIKSGGRPDYEELRYAIMALDALSTFDHMAMRKIAEREKEGKKPFLVSSAVFQHDEQFKRWKTALNSDPKKWCGESNDPDSPEYQKCRALALRLFKKVTGESSI